MRSYEKAMGKHTGSWAGLGLAQEVAIGSFQFDAS